MRYRPNRNLVTRHADGRQVNVARMRGHLFVCAEACCCGRVDMKNSPLNTDLYHEEWLRRRLRNIVHLTIGGCLGPCALANVNLLLFDGRAIWLQSINSDETVAQVFDWIEAMLDADGYVEPSQDLAAHVFTASSWQGRPDGQPVEDRRLWRGREARPEPTPSCELPAEAFAGAVETGQLRVTGVSREVLGMEGVAAIPRKNGELVFAEPWQGRVFGMATAMNEAGLFEWEVFRQRLIARIAEAGKSSEPFEYYACWLAALEDVLAGLGMVVPEELGERTSEFEFGERVDVF